MEYTAVDREGTFRAAVIGYGLKEMESNAVAVNVHVVLTETWDAENKAWVDWREYNVDAYGDIWIVKKDGTVNKKSAQSLVDCAGWDGDTEAIVNQQWKPTPCQVVIKRDDYEGKVRFNVAFLNEYDREPGANLGNVTPDKAKALAAKFGSQFRALVGNRIRNSAPPATDKPKAPPPVSRPAPPADFATHGPDGKPRDGVPF